MYVYIYNIYIIHIKEVKEESRLTPSKDDRKMRCILKVVV